MKVPFLWGGATISTRSLYAKLSLHIILQLSCTPVTENDWGIQETRQPGYKNNFKMFYIPAVVFPIYP